MLPRCMSKPFRMGAGFVAWLLFAGPVMQVASADDFALSGGVSPQPPGAPGGDPNVPPGSQPSGPHQPPAQNESGKQQKPRRQLDPVRVDRGEYFTEVQDVRIPGRGLSVELRRYYRSQSGYNGPLGYGWNFGYNKRL